MTQVYLPPKRIEIDFTLTDLKVLLFLPSPIGRKDNIWILLFESQVCVGVKYGLFFMMSTDKYYYSAHRSVTHEQQRQFATKLHLWMSFIQAEGPKNV